MKVIPHVSMVLFAVLFAAFFTTVTSAADIRTDYNHKVNFEQFHSYCWGNVQTTDPLWVPRIKEAVNKALQAKGWQEAPSGCDVTVMAVGAAHDQKEYQTFYDNLGGGWGWGGWGGGTGLSTTSVENTRVGTLVIDMYQANDKKLIWRGTSSDTLSNKAQNNIKDLDKNVDKMFKNFPPK
jgi:Domain of unknown function (DUF4136)